MLKYKSFLITGGAGFIGSSLARIIKKYYPDSKVFVCDNLKRRGAELNLAKFKEEGIEFYHADIRLKEEVINLPRADIVLECSAEASVISGYNNSPYFIINNNLMGMVNCLELCRQNNSAMIFFSTSRVYPYNLINSLKIIESETRFQWDSEQDIKRGWSLKGINENFPLEGVRSFYGATKLAGEYFLQEYIHAYGIKGVINRCSVVSGPGQFGKSDQGIFSYWLAAHYFKRPLSYIGFAGKGKQVRDVLHIDDLCNLIIKQINNLEEINGLIFNIGGGKENSLSLIETTEICKQITGNQLQIDKIKDTRPADVNIFISDIKLAKEKLNWQPQKSPKDVLTDIYYWIKENENTLRLII